MISKKMFLAVFHIVITSTNQSALNLPFNVLQIEVKSVLS